jgi:hypothetical protein
MAMQYDVLSYHNTVSGVAVPFRTRLKGIVVSPSASSTLHVGVFNNTYSTGTYTQSASTTITVTLTAHGLNTGDSVYLNCTTGNGDSNVYSITKTGDNTFTVVSPTSETTSGAVRVYSQVLTEIDCATGTSFYTLIPGEGVVGQDGLYVGLPSSGTVTSTIFYG